MVISMAHENLNILAIVLFLGIALLLVGCVKPPITHGWGSNNSNGSNIILLEPPAKAIPLFTSCQAIKDSFTSANSGYGYSYRGGLFETVSGGLPMTSTVMTKSAGDTSASSSNSVGYSTTNVQVKGVDEADIVKTDGEYIYTVSRGKLSIINAYPADGMELVSSTDLGDVEPVEIFIGGDYVLVFGSNYEQIIMKTNNGDGESGTGEPSDSANASVVTQAAQAIAEKIMPPIYPDYSRNFAVAEIWDVSDKAHPEKVRSVDIEGNYLTSRKIGSDVFYVVNTYPQIYYEGVGSSPIIPSYREDGALTYEPIAKCGEVGYLPPVHSGAFVTIAKLSLANPEDAVVKKTVVAQGQNVYASEDYLYLAETDYNYGYPQLLSEAIGSKESMEKTIIHKFKLTDELDYLGSMSAPGRILNQFSMDEYNGNFRIATTLGQVSRGSSSSSSNIYVFNSELERIGELEDLAPGEKIYSARFMGAKGYLVTFKKVDPLFVIDLSDPEKPTVLGKLKIPGYSDYLHPIDENHIIGVGKDTVEAEEGDFAWYQGIKLAIFDVSDVEHPKEMFKTMIGDRGTDSYALRDHKAFLFDREKELLVLPITLAEIDPEKYGKYDELPANTYGDFIFQGAYVYKLNLEGGFKLRGRITHQDDDESYKKSGYYYYGGGTEVKRSLYIGDALYTISDNMVKANSLDDLEEIETVKLG